MNRSSESRKARSAPRLARIPAFLAAEAPLLPCAIYRMGPEICRTTFAVSSSDPSSTTITSKSCRPEDRIEARQAGRKVARLNVGTITLQSGTGMLVAARQALACNPRQRIAGYCCYRMWARAGLPWRSLASTHLGCPIPVSRMAGRAWATPPVLTRTAVAGHVYWCPVETRTANQCDRSANLPATIDQCQQRLRSPGFQFATDPWDLHPRGRCDSCHA